MLEAIISLRRDDKTNEIGRKEKGLKRVGDVVCVKRSPAIWSWLEKKRFLIVYLQDDELEAEMVNKDSHGRTYPYAVFKEIETGHEMTCRSKYQVDLRMFKNSPGLDGTKESGAVKPDGKEHLALTDMQLVRI